MSSPVLYGLFFCNLVAGISLGQEIKVPPGSFITHIEHAAKVSDPFETPLFKSIDHQSPGNKWAFSVHNRSSHTHALDGLEEIKAAKLIEKQNSAHPHPATENSSRAFTPILGTNFEANWSILVSPPDNTLAISDVNILVTANNDGIEYYTTTGQLLYFDFWSDFFDESSLTSIFFDPKVIYDSGSDRFFLVVLFGSSYTTSKVMVCFSKTNNPLDGWWVYTLSGNPLLNNCWFDYPGLGVSNNEFYITGNLYNNSSQFNQAIIFQIPKSAGLEGDTLAWQYWYDLGAPPFKGFGLVPASWGHDGNYGPGLYFISTEPNGKDNVYLWDLTDDMNGSPQIIRYVITTDEYDTAANAHQAGSNDLLDNGNCRVMSAFYLEGIIHFVFHMDIGQGWSGINYSRLQVSPGTIQYTTLGLEGSYDYAYPAIASCSTDPADQSVMIAFLRCSDDIYPEVRVVNCDHDMNWSISTLVKEGETYVDFLTGQERWGDYTGISRGADSRVWLAGSYGADIPAQSTFNTYKTWVAEVLTDTSVQVSNPVQENVVSVFPNPVYDILQLEFVIDHPGEISITIYDTHGRLVKLLYRDVPKSGLNRLTFNKGALSPGTYYVHVRTDHHVMLTEKIIVAK